MRAIHPARPSAAVLSALLLSAALAAGPGCGAPGRRYEERVREAPATEQHAVHSARLRELMQGLDALTRERLPQSLDVATLRRARLRDVERVALGIAETAEAIPWAAGAQGAGADGELEIRAAEMRQRALRLADAAAAGDPDAARLEARHLERACVACHQRFREAP